MCRGCVAFRTWWAMQAHFTGWPSSQYLMGPLRMWSLITLGIKIAKATRMIKSR